MCDAAVISVPDDPDTALDVALPEPDDEPPLLHLDEGTISGRVEVYTDGACLHNQSASLRRAGVGAWWADGHSSNFSAPLTGHVQTNNRAEVSAVLHVLANESRDVHIKTDSEYVLQGCLRHCFAWAALGWHKVKNADLWRQVHAKLCHRGSAVALSKVKGHATLKDVSSGRVSARDKHGNDAADSLASEAAAANSLPKQAVKEVLHRKRVVRNVQLMMTRILAARSQQLQIFAATTPNAHRDDASCTSSSESSSLLSEPQSQALVVLVILPLTYSLL